MRYYLPLLILLLAACKGNDPKEQPATDQIKILGNTRLSPLYDSLLKEYARQAPDAKGYALFYDKHTEEMFSITIASYRKTPMDPAVCGAMNYFFLADSIPVYLFTGIEDLVINDDPAFANAGKVADSLKGGEYRTLTNRIRQIDFAQSWTYVHAGDTTYVVKGANLPFSGVRVLQEAYFHQPDTASE